MTDLIQILDGTIDTITAALKDLTVEQLSDLRVMEEANKGRVGVDRAIAAALAALGVGAVDDAAPDEQPVVEPALPEDPAPSLDQTSEIDMSHFAVDTDLRAGTTVDQNRIDFNDPRIDGRDVVEAALAAQIEG